MDIFNEFMNAPLIVLTAEDVDSFIAENNQTVADSHFTAIECYFKLNEELLETLKELLATKIG